MSNTAGADVCADAALDGTGACGDDAQLYFCSTGTLWVLDCAAYVGGMGLTDGSCAESEKTVSCVGVTEAAGPDSCPYANDGECDEPDFCTADTDNSDCAADNCAYANDDVCDVPRYCDDGTDVDDCARVNSCEYANDGECDEPETCAEGTDTTDCTADSCEYANDGECDEPETCAEGTDTTDCTP